MSDFSVHDQDDFAPVYDEDDPVTIRRGDLRALLDLATGSMDFGSGFWDNEQVEIVHKIADILGVDRILVTPHNFVCQYKGHHAWRKQAWRTTGPVWYCPICRHTATDRPAELSAEDEAAEDARIAQEAKEAEERVKNR